MDPPASRNSFIQEDRSSIEALCRVGWIGVFVAPAGRGDDAPPAGPGGGRSESMRCVSRRARADAGGGPHQARDRCAGAWSLPADGLNSAAAVARPAPRPILPGAVALPCVNTSSATVTDLVESLLWTALGKPLSPLSPMTASTSTSFWEDGVIAEPGVQSLAAGSQRCNYGSLCSAISSAQGAGPMPRRVTGRCSDRMALVGDAAGFVDSISGDGLSGRLELGAAPRAPSAGRACGRRNAGKHADIRTRPARRLFRRYWLVTTGLLVLARHPRARAAAITYLRRIVRLGLRSRGARCK